MCSEAAAQPRKVTHQGRERERTVAVKEGSLPTVHQKGPTADAAKHAGDDNRTVPQSRVPIMKADCQAVDGLLGDTRRGDGSVNEQ